MVPDQKQPAGCQRRIKGIHVALNHGKNGVFVSLTSGIDCHVQYVIKIDPEVESRRSVTDDKAVVLLEGTVVFDQVIPCLPEKSDTVILRVTVEEGFPVIVVHVPQDLNWHVCNDFEPGETLPTILTREAAERLAAAFVIEEVVAALARKLGYQLVPKNMMPVPKVPVEPRSTEIPIAVPPTVASGPKKPTGGSHKVRHQKAPKPKFVPKIRTARKISRRGS